jgi:molybdopterin converting factor small subunit
MAKIFIPTPLRKFTQNLSSFDTTGATVQDAIRELVFNFNDLGKQILDEQKNLKSFIRVYVGENDINDLESIYSKVEKGDIINIVPAIAGGTN